MEQTNILKPGDEGRGLDNDRRDMWKAINSLRDKQVETNITLTKLEAMLCERHRAFDERCKVREDAFNKIIDSLLMVDQAHDNRIKLLEMSRSKFYGILIGVASLTGLFSGIVVFFLGITVNGTPC